MLPKIEQQIIADRNKRVLTVGAFMSIGIATFGVITQNWNSLAILASSTLTVPLILTGLIKKIKIKQGQQDPFKTGIQFIGDKRTAYNFIANYLDNSDSLITKKYKVICLGLWMNHKKVSLFDEVDKNKSDNKKKLSQLTDELIAKGETKKRLDGIFYKIDSTSNFYLVSQENIMDFFEEDEGNWEKLEIARNVYKEYAGIGMAATALLRAHIDFNVIIKLQDYRFTDQDISVLEAHIYAFEKEKKANKDKVLSPLPYSEKPNESVDSLLRIIGNTDNAKHLEILNRVYDVKYCSIFPHLKDSYQIILNAINKKINYFNMSEELARTEDKKASTKKLKL